MSFTEDEVRLSFFNRVLAIFADVVCESAINKSKKNELYVKNILGPVFCFLRHCHTRRIELSECAHLQTLQCLCNNSQQIATLRMQRRFFLIQDLQYKHFINPLVKYTQNAQSLQQIYPNLKMPFSRIPANVGNNDVTAWQHCWTADTRASRYFSLWANNLRTQLRRSSASSFLCLFQIKT